MKRVATVKICVMWIISLLILSLTACGNYDRNQNELFGGGDVRPKSVRNGSNLLQKSTDPNGVDDMGNETMNGEALRNDSITSDSLRNESQTNESKMNGSMMNESMMNDTMMNGQVMNDQQKRIRNDVLKVEGVNDATIVINDKNIIVGIDVDNVGRRVTVVNSVTNMLQSKYDNYQIHVTAERATHDRIRVLKDQMKPMDATSEHTTQHQHDHPVDHFAHDFKALLEEMGAAVTEPLR